jgi:protein-tyrosine phosphatase
MANPFERKGLLNGYLRNLTRQYGRKKAWLIHLCTSALLCLGGYNRFRRVNWRHVRRLVFVCKGNTCRSAYCEARARTLGLSTTSRGLEAGVQGGTPKLIVDLAASRGVDLSRHRPQQFRLTELVPGDLVVVMEPSQANAIRRQLDVKGIQITILGLWHQRVRPYLQDPFGLPELYLETCLTFMDTAIERLGLELIENEHRDQLA